MRHKERRKDKTMERTEIHPTELKVFMNHIYELKKGV